LSEFIKIVNEFFHDVKDISDVSQHIASDVSQNTILS